MKTLLTGVLALACSTSAFAQDALLATGTPERLPITLSSEPKEDNLFGVRPLVRPGSASVRGSIRPLFDAT